MNQEKRHSRKTVLVTGGTKGIGLAVALQFAREGYQTIMTYNWGSADENEILRQFEAENLPLPMIRQADVISIEDTRALVREIQECYGKVDTLISNVSFSSLVRTLDDLTEKALFKSIEYSSWPIVEYPRIIHEVTGHYPRYVIGMSSHGPDTHFPNYDYAAVTKAVMEVLVKYLNFHFFDKEVIFNMLRTRTLITDSWLATAGNDWTTFIERFEIPGTEVSFNEVAKTAYMLCSGYMDGIRGQTIVADKGYAFSGTLEYVYSQRERLGLQSHE